MSNEREKERVLKMTLEQFQKWDEDRNQEILARMGAQYGNGNGDGN
jgi:hypothetical protein